MSDNIDDRAGRELGLDQGTPVREEYSAPTLTLLGDFATLTQFRLNPGADGGQASV